jgi:hypothetical protein
MDGIKEFLASIGKGVWAVLGFLSAGGAAAGVYMRNAAVQQCKTLHGCNLGTFLPSTVKACKDCANAGTSGTTGLTISVVGGAIAIAGFTGALNF